MSPQAAGQTWELRIPESRTPFRAILDCPERLYVAWHRSGGGRYGTVCVLLDSNGLNKRGCVPQASLWEVREYRRVAHVEGVGADYERVEEARP